MFDLAFLVVLVVAIVRAARARVAPAVALGAASLALLLLASVSALLSDAFGGRVEGAFGVIFIGPTVILHEREGLAGVALHPLGLAIAWLACCAVAAWVSAQRARDLHPDRDDARRLNGVVLAFVGAGTFAGIRLVTVLLFLALSREP